MEELKDSYRFDMLCVALIINLHSQVPNQAGLNMRNYLPVIQVLSACYWYKQGDDTEEGIAIYPKEYYINM